MGVLSVKDRGVVHDAKLLPTHDRFDHVNQRAVAVRDQIEATGPSITAVGGATVSQGADLSVGPNCSPRSTPSWPA